MTHTHSTGTGKIHSFRGLLADGEQEKISIQGSVGAVAWRIIKLELFPNLPGSTDYENVVKVFREEQDSITGTVDFTDGELLAAAYMEGYSGNADTDGTYSIFDNDLFSRNIYVTNKDISTGESVNYYIELEEVKVGKAGMAQLAVAAAKRDPSLA